MYDCIIIALPGVSPHRPVFFLLFSDLVRRVCDKTEKDFLREKGVVSETQSDLGNKHR